jgi:CheY-like chemotaxis protein
MPDTKANLLVVDDEPSNRMSLASLLREIGYRARTAEDGLSALIEIGAEVPDILLSDLHMPGMSGFELLAVVRREFPALRTIAMSGAFCGDEVPSGVAADAFYQKGSDLGRLLRMIETLPHRERMAIDFATVLPADQHLSAPIQSGPGGASAAPGAMQLNSC